MAVGDWVVARSTATATAGSCRGCRRRPTSRARCRRASPCGRPATSTTALLVRGLDETSPAPHRALSRSGAGQWRAAGRRADEGRCRREAAGPARRAPGCAEGPPAGTDRPRGRRCDRTLGRPCAGTLPRSGADAGHARLVGRGQVDLDQHAARRRDAGHRRSARERRPRHAPTSRALAASTGRRRLRHRHAGVRTLRPDTDAATLAAKLRRHRGAVGKLRSAIAASRRARLRGARGHRSGPSAQLPESCCCESRRDTIGRVERQRLAAVSGSARAGDAG